MSIYATFWQLQFPRHGDDYIGCEWIKVMAQGVPAHIGTPTPGHGYEAGDPFASFLPPAIAVPEGDDGMLLRAVVFVAEGTQKGTARSGQEYQNPLLVLTGADYTRLSFGDLHKRICDALRGDLPRIIGQFLRPDGSVQIFFEDGGSEDESPGS